MRVPVATAHGLRPPHVRRSDRVAILHDPVPPGASPDRLDTLVQARAVSDALASRGIDCRMLACGDDRASLAQLLRPLGPCQVFNLVEAVAGDATRLHLAPEWLAAEGLSFTGADADCMRLTTDKQASKQVMAAAGIPVPADHGPDAPAGRYIVKSRCEDASLGLDAGSVVDREEVPSRLAYCENRWGGAWFAERYIEGREFNLSILEIDGWVRALPAAEIVFQDFPPGQPHIVDYRAKWQEDSFEYHATRRVFPDAAADRPLLRHLDDIALRCWNLFGLHGYARVDFRVDDAGQPWVLEVNANPCLSPDAGFAAALERAGIDFAEAIVQILGHAHHGTNQD